MSLAKVLTDLDDAVDYLNALYESDSTAPGSSDEDYTVWTALFNIGINIWENEEGVLWRELFVFLADASTGDKTTAAATNSYDVPDDFVFPASGFVWLGTGTAKTAYQVIAKEEMQLGSSGTGHWCYFTGSKLEFNPNVNMIGGETINYEYYKTADKLTTGADTFEMGDPMFVVYYALSELKKEEGNSDEVLIASQKLEAMKTKNMMGANYQVSGLVNMTESGFN